MSEKGSHMLPPEKGDSERPELSTIWDKAEYVASILPANVERQVDTGPTSAHQYYNSKKDAEEAAAQAPILHLDHIASSVHFIFDDGEILEVTPIQKFGEIKPGPDKETPVEFTMSATHELAPDLVQELTDLAERNPYITDAKVVYYQSAQKLFSPE